MRHFKKLFMLLLVLAVAWVAAPVQAANVAYQAAYVAGLEGTIDFDSASAGAFKVALVTSSYTPNPDHTSFTTSIQPYEVTGSGYTAGGASLASPDVTANTTDNRCVWDATDTSWNPVTVSAVRYAVIYHVATSIPVSCKDFSTDKSASGGEFLIQWASTGIAYIAMP
jgi:hypothetical protein